MRKPGPFFGPPPVGCICVCMCLRAGLQSTHHPPELHCNNIALYPFFLFALPTPTRFVRPSLSTFRRVSRVYLFHSSVRLLLFRRSVRCAPFLSFVFISLHRIHTYTYLHVKYTYKCASICYAIFIPLGIVAVEHVLNSALFVLFDRNCYLANIFCSVKSIEYSFANLPIFLYRKESFL